MLTVLCTVPEWKRTSYANVMIKTKRCKCLLTRRNDVTKSISIYYSSISIYILWRARWSVCRHYNTQIHNISPALWIIHHSFSFSPQIPFTFGTTTERRLHGAVNRLETSQTCVNFKLQITSGHECSEQICGKDGDWINDPLPASSPFKSIFHTFTIYNYRINYSL